MQTASDNLNLILNSLGMTGIYVIREDDHTILFYNQRAQELIPGMQVGAVCSDIWGSNCGTCPLLDMGDKQSNQSFNFDGPLHRPTDIMAVRTMWDGDIPAFIISFAPHVETYNPTYEKIVKGNLTTDECTALKMTDEERSLLPEAGFTLSLALSTFAGSGLLYREDVQRFLEFSSLENMSRELSSGREVLMCTYRRVTERGCRWNTMEVMPDVNYTEENQSVMIYVKDVQDIYQEGLSHEALSQKNEAIFRALGKENFGIYVVDLATGDTEWVREASEDSSFIHEDSNWDKVAADLEQLRYHPDSRQDFRENFSRSALIAACEAGNEKTEIMLKRKVGGEWRYVNASAHFYSGADGQKYAILTFQNVDAFVRREMYHIQAERRMASVIRSGYSVMNLVDLDTGVCERAMLDKLMEARPMQGNYEEWIERAARAPIPEEDRKHFIEALSIDNLRKKAAEVKSFKEEAVQYRLNDRGTLRWLEQRIFYIRQDDKVDVSIFGRDVTEEKLRQEAEREKELREKAALEDALNTANAANAAKSDFLSRMSHDIRTPMNAIIGMTAIAGTHLDDKARVADCLSKITSSGRHLLSLINEVLDLSKIESGRLELSEEEFELSGFFDDLMTMVMPGIRAKKQSLEFKLHEVKHERVVADRLRLQQVFTNILSNAVKYTPEGGEITIDIQEGNSTVSGYGCYTFVVRDTGIGMSQEYLKHIFEPFSRANTARSQKAEGTGLGMAIVKNIVQMMGGEIAVKSQENVGSEFTVTLFLKLGDDENESIRALVDLPVLVADDDRDACESACIIIDELGMKSEWVLSGTEAVEKVAAAHDGKNDYFAVILDWKMPGMDGIETARRIRQIVGPDVTIIILSSFDWSDVEEEARAAGVDGFITKPLFKSRLAYLFKQFTAGVDAGKAVNDELKTIGERDFSDKRLLLVEDNDLNREIAVEIIGMTGARIDCAVNGKEAVEMFAASRPGYYDLIFMDIQMPVMNGYESTRAIRALSREDAAAVPIVAMSADAFASDVSASRQAGMNEHMIKPLDFKRLTKCMDKWLR